MAALAPETDKTEPGGRPEGRPLSTFILKVAGRCNIDCDYCYMFHLADQSWRDKPKFMSDEVVQQIARQIGEHARQHDLRSVRVILHGGEPLLYGPARVRNLCQAVERELPPTTGASFGIQTNGTLLSRAWLSVLREHRISVSFSLDGSPQANDRHRRSRNGRSTWEAAVRGIELLRTEEPSAYSAILAVIDVENDPVETYQALAALAPPVMDFNLPHAHHDEPPSRSQQARSPVYGRWLTAVFDEWAAAPQYSHSVRVFDHIIGLEIGVVNSVESLGLAPVDLIVVESDGTIEGVDALKASYAGAPHLALDVFSHDFDAALRHPAVSSRQLGRLELAAKCQSCELVSTCGGGYLPHRYSASNAFKNPSVYCEDLAFLIEHVKARIAPLL